MSERVVVVGNGMVGHHLVTQLVGNDDLDVMVIGGEPRPAYDRVHLSEFFDGKTAKELQLTTREAYEEQGVGALFGDPVVAVDPAAKVVTTQGGRKIIYDRLVLATGSYPFVPPIPGSDAERCLVYRTIDDLGLIRATAKQAKVGVVVGGGLLGLEAANALVNLGLETHVIEFGAGLMAVQLDDPGSAMLRREIESLGVIVHTQTNTENIEQHKNHTLTMHFDNNTTLDTDLIVFSAGIRPYDNLAADAGLTPGVRGGFKINESCQTSQPDIYAIGECASFRDQIFGLVAPGYRMAETVAQHISGDKGSFQGADMSTKLKLLGVGVGTLGDSKGTTEGVISYTYSNERTNIYKSLKVDSSGKHLLGAVLVGDTGDYDVLHQYYLNDIELPESPESMILPAAQGGVPLLGASALPKTATICSCHNVSKGDIFACLDGGALNAADVTASTKAGSGCGGCVALLKNVVDDEITARGGEVSRAICEHFDYSRQELFDIVRGKQLRTFRELILRHGNGLGCDVCKPTVASMLASLWNEHVLEDTHRGLQDTNDLYLGNMQKNGTYSVVPRVPGGEITPQKLIVLGEVAKEYDLYTKITGGQRIDLFGAEVHQLPEIWRRLIDAGFETGHAYGKAMRTVKSCVGSTWCRYGVQDSVAMAIFLEKRYRGLRSPHKFKLGVSGCTRECAEAQSKDIGVIATENGWNLFVCGNGGMRPRHADLFAKDLDDQTLVSYIDRILMFYVRTADRLQRTSVWLENMEGGLEYLRSVVIDDKLDIGADLEAQMDDVIDTYECEWKATIEDPEKLKRFQYFVNSDATDDGVVFTRERGQKRPPPDTAIPVTQLGETA